MNCLFTGCLLALLLSSGASGAAAPDAQSGIPARPEELKFPSLAYDPPAPAQYRVVLKSGPVAYVVPDHELPLVNIVVYVHTGEYLDPAGKEGLADLTGTLLESGGTRSKTAEQLQERLAFLAAQLRSSIAGPIGTVSLNLLSKDTDEGLSILREVLSAPRFQENKVALRKQQMIQAMQERNDDLSEIESREAQFLAYGEQFWANRYSTAASVRAITREDLESFHRKWFFPSNVVVAASGDFDRAAMIQKLEKMFADWPFAGQHAPPVPSNTMFAVEGIYLVNKPDVNQGRVTMMLPGILRDNPDIYAVQVMNDILGGGGFSSRILNRVRSDEGLAYSVRSSFPGGTYYSVPFRVGFQSKSRTVAYAASLVREELKRIASAPVSEAELGIARKGLIERFPRNFTTKAQVASIFAQDEYTGRYARDPDYWKQYRSRVSAVGIEDVLRVAKKYLDVDKLVILAAGNKEDILRGYPTHLVNFPDLAGGRVTELPLRDPLTMKPLPLSPP